MADENKEKHLELLSDQIGIMYSYYYQYKNTLYGDNDMEKRKELAQFYTPPQLSSKMLEKYDCDLAEFKEKTILDPTCGSGLLLLDALIAGAEPDKVFGIELDKTVLELAHERLCDDKNPVWVPDLEYKNGKVSVKPYKDGDDYMEIPDAEYSAENGITYNAEAKYDPEKLWDKNAEPKESTDSHNKSRSIILDGVKTKKIKVKKVNIPETNIHHGNALNSDCYIFPESKYETDLKKGTTYKFNPDVGDKGNVEFVKSDGAKAFKFGF